MRFAIIENGKVVNVAESEEALSANWVQSDSAVKGDLFDGSTFAKPVIAENKRAVADEKIEELKQAALDALVAATMAPDVAALDVLVADGAKTESDIRGYKRA